MAVESSNWSTKDLAALESAIAQGVQKVKYTDKEIEYRSLNEMLRLRDVMRRELGLVKKSMRLKAQYDKGLC